LKVYFGIDGFNFTWQIKLTTLHALFLLLILSLKEMLDFSLRYLTTFIDFLIYKNENYKNTASGAIDHRTMRAQ
jgi:hypothetical protein